MAEFGTAISAVNATLTDNDLWLMDVRTPCCGKRMAERLKRGSAVVFTCPKCYQVVEIRA